MNIPFQASNVPNINSYGDYQTLLETIDKKIEFVFDQVGKFKKIYRRHCKHRRSLS